MDNNESALRAIRDRVANTMGIIEETAATTSRKESRRHLADAARELHKCADEIQNILMRMRAH